MSTASADEPFSLKAQFDDPGPSTQSVTGMSVAMSEDGSTVALGYISSSTVGAAVAGESVPAQTVALVYVRPRHGWPSKPAPSAWLTSPAGTIFGGVGIAVSADGSTITVLGGSGKNLVTTTAWVFGRPAGGWSGTVSPAATLSAPGASGGDVTVLFGIDLGMTPDGSLIVVGRPGQKDVLVFARPSHGWAGTLSANASLTAPVGQPDQNFGVSAAISADGSIAAAGIGENVDGTSPVSGRIYLFSRPPGGWTGHPLAQATLLDPANISANPLSLSTVIDDAGANVVATFTTVVSNANDVRSDGILVFARPAAGWNGEIHPSARLTFPGLVPFRAWVSGDGTTVASDWLSFDASGPTGADVLLFRRPGESWSDSSLPEATLPFPTVNGAIPFGFSISGDRRGDRWIAGALVSQDGNLEGSSAFEWEIPPVRAEIIPAPEAIPDPLHTR